MSDPKKIDCVNERRSKRTSTALEGGSRTKKGQGESSEGSCDKNLGSMIGTSILETKEEEAGDTNEVDLDKKKKQKSIMSGEGRAPLREESERG